MSLFQVRTTNASGMGDEWGGQVWESDLIGASDAAVREYNDILRDNMIPALSAIHPDDVAERLLLVMNAEIDRMVRWGAQIARLTKSGENVAEINDGFYRVELRCIED